jgi:hypothetical protein
VGQKVTFSPLLKPSIYNLYEKQGIFRLTNNSFSRCIISVIRNTLDFSFSLPIDTCPHLPTADDIDLTPY